MNKSTKFSWDRVQSGQSTDCWPWIGSLNTWGYGSCQHDGKSMNASRAAYMVAYGKPAPGLVVCHSCDNPACCNPAHLSAQPQSENLRQARERGRQRYATGEAHHRCNAKLTPERVTEARRLYASGISQSEIGRQWGIHSSVISRAVRGENWAHVK